MAISDATPPIALSRDRVVRLVEYGLVGASGVPVDLAVTAGSIALGVHYLAAQVLGFAVAVTWNFGLNWWVTFDRPAGSLLRQYVGYVSVQAGSLSARVAIVAALVELLAAPVLGATAVGIGAAAVLGFLFSERVFGVGP